MIYVPENYKNFKYLVSYSDNYVVLTNISRVSADWQNPRNIDIIVQYFNPSISTISTTLTINNNRSFDTVSTSDDFYLRGDCSSIVVAQFCLLIWVLFLINAMTRLFKKGGLFFGS